MHLRLLIALVVVSVGSETNGATSGLVSGRDEVHAAIRKSLPVLEKKGVAWMTKRKCVSCHQITSMLWSLNLVADSVIGFERTKLDRWTAWSAEKMTAIVADPKRSPPVDNLTRLLLGRYPVSKGGKDLYAKFPEWLAGSQTNGFWKAAGQLPRQKRPFRETDEVTTMWTILALTPFARQDADLAEQLKLAQAWVAEGKSGVTTEWWVVRALTERGKARNRLKQDLIKRQNPDGGWSWVEGKPSDPLGTGLALYGLARMGVQPTHKTLRSAADYLLGSQQDDGSWETPSTKRANKDEPNPISNYWGTAWAVIGLASAWGS
jgi:hypothetical protein